MMGLLRNVTVNLVLWLGLTAFAAPTTLTYQGRILKSDGKPLQHNNVSFVFQITDPSGACVIYQEQVDGYDMTNSGGVFDRPIGSGSRSFPASGAFTISEVFNNSAPLACKGGSTYSPAITDGRKLRVQFYDGQGWNLISPDNVIRSVPYASFSDAANKLGSNSAGDFVLKTAVNAGTSCDSGSFLTWNATTQSFGCAAVSGASGGTVTNVTSTNAYLSVTNGAATPALTVNVGTAANTVAAGNDPRFTDSRPPNGAASGDLGDNYPAPKVVKLQGVDLSTTAPTSGQILKYSGASWGPSTLAISDVTGLSIYLSGTLLQSQFPASCTASQTLTFLAPSGSFSCSNISVSGGNFVAQAANTVFAGPTSGSATPSFRALEASDLPASISSGLWSSSGSDVYRAAGNVGIGTATPGFTLDVAGPINSNYKVEINRDGNSALLLLQSYRASTNHSKVQMRGARGTQASPVTLNSGDILGELRYDSWTSGTNFGNSGNIQVVADDNHSATSTPARMEFYTTAAGATSSTTPAMTISSNAYLGVGTTNPQRRFHVRSDGTYQFRIENGSAGGGYWNIGQSDSVFGTGGGKLLFVPNSDASTSATVVFTNSGNVGIGTTSPTTRLDVAGTVKATAFEGPLTASTNSVGAGSNASPSLTFSGDTNTGFYNTSSNDIISVATGGTKIFDFSSTGLVSSTSGGALITTAAGSATTPTFSFAGDPDTGWFSPLANTLAATTGGAERVRIDASGNIGIGTTAPSAMLHVVGDGRSAAPGFLSYFNTDGTNLSLGRYRGSVGAPEALQAGDRIGSIIAGAGTSASTSHNTAAVEFFAEDAYTSTSAPSYIRFGTTASGSVSRTERMRIDSKGNVGIGVTDPSFAMSFSSDIRNFAIAGAGTESAASAGSIEIANNRPTSTVGDYLGNLDFISVNNGAGTRKLGARIQSQLVGSGGANGFGADLMFFTKPDNVTFNSTHERMRITSSGNVGIGTTNPDALLNVNGRVSAGKDFKAGSSDPIAYQGAYLQWNRSGSDGSTYLLNNKGTGTGGIIFGKSDNSNAVTEQARITDLGNVGIGTATPGYKLHVADTANTTIQVEATTSGVRGGLSSDTPVSGAFYTGSYTNSPFVLGVNNAERMRITTSGNVGIGTTSPNSRLQVASAGNTATDYTARFQSSGSTAGAGGILFDQNSTYSYKLHTNGTSATTGSMIFSYINNSTGAVVNDNNLVLYNGNVGIGTTSPGYKLHVVGTAGLSTGTAWTNASDARLKDIQGDYEYGLNEILKLHTVRYNYKKDNALGLPSDFNKTGFIAQEVREVIPDAVSERPDGYLELNVDPIHWAVVNAIQELYNKFIAGQKEVSAQSRELASVKAAIRAKDQKIETLEKENAAIKSYLCSKDPKAPICQ